MTFGDVSPISSQTDLDRRYSTAGTYPVVIGPTNAAGSDAMSTLHEVVEGKRCVCLVLVMSNVPVVACRDCPRACL